MNQNQTGTNKVDYQVEQKLQARQEAKTRNKNQREKKLSITQAYFIGSKQDPYHPITNPLGYILFGVSVNRRLMHRSLQCLPKFLTIDDLNYGNFGGNDQFNQWVGKLSNTYTQHETKSALNLQCIIEIFFSKFKFISIEGDHNEFVNIEPIISYSGAEIIDKQQQSSCHVIFISKSGKYGEIAKQKAKIAQKPTLLVFENNKEIDREENDNVFVCYQLVVNKLISFGSVHCCNPTKLQQLLNLFNLHSVSTLTQAATISNIQPQQQSNDFQHAQDKLRENVIQLIKSVNGIEVKEENLLFFNGATSVLVFVAKVFFNDGDTVSIDVPAYPGIEGDFLHKVAVKFQAENMFKSTLLKRVIRAKEDGSKGYVIINANNPTGHAYSAQQVKEVCEWAEFNQDFILIFDQMYINLIHGGIKSLSSAEYSKRLPNIQTIRGFAKQFGLCGFKVAYLTTSNRKAIDSYNEWKEMLIPHPYTLSTVSNFLQKSSNGQQILSAGLRLAEEAISSTCLLLDQYNIKYLRPKGGVFVFIDLRQYLEENIDMNEYMMFKKLFYEYKVNVCCGQDYKCPQPGWFRLCPVIDEQNVIAGIRRIHLMLSYQPLR